MEIFFSGNPGRDDILRLPFRIFRVVIIEPALRNDLDDGQSNVIENAHGDLLPLHKRFNQDLFIVSPCLLQCSKKFFLLFDDGDSDRRPLPCRFDHDRKGKGNFSRRLSLNFLPLKKFEGGCLDLLVEKDLLGHHLMKGEGARQDA